MFYNTKKLMINVKIAIQYMKFEYYLKKLNI